MVVFKRKCKITFICHGATINTEENRLFDDENYPAINSNGKREMEEISEFIKNKGLKIDKIYASTALRTTQSARIISQICGVEFETIDNLFSRKMGEWSGLTYDEIEEKFPKMLEEYHNDRENFKTKGGETIPEFNKRVHDVINKIIEENLNKRLIIVTHADVIQAAIADILDIPVQSQFKIRIPTGSATQISYYTDFASLIYSAYEPV